MRLTWYLSLVCLATGLVWPSSTRATGIEVVINEVHYHPADATGLGEFIEIFNHGLEAVDLGGWEFRGAVRMRFAEGVILPAGGYLVAVKDADVILDQHDLDFELIAGVYLGSLDNDGEGLELVDRDGYRISWVEYGDGSPWPEAADGLGSSLERLSWWREDDDPHAWLPSTVAGGTPGAPNSVLRPEPPVQTLETIFSENSTWSYFPGTEAPDPDWSLPSFDASSWATGPAGFGYSDFDDETLLPDMSGNYLTVFIRREIELTLLDEIRELRLRIDYDDGFRVHLNGLDVGGRNVNNPGWDQPAAGSHEAGSPEDIVLDLEAARAVLVEGTNVIGIQGHNSRIDSGDFSLNPLRLQAVRQEGPPPDPGVGHLSAPRDVVINEILLGSPGNGWVELHNPTGEAVELGGRRIGLFPGSSGQFEFPAGLTLAAGEFLALGEGELGFELDRGPVILLTLADGRIVDALNPRDVSTLVSTGRFPDGDTGRRVFPEPTPGEPNRLPDPPDVVIHEIHYHPADDDLGGEFIELTCVGEEGVDLTGWAFTRGITYNFPPGTRLEPGEFLVIARDPQALESHRGIAGVLGPYEGRLRNDAETVLLRDELRNPVDRVRFADEGSWPEGTDGQGPSIELVHPELENRYGPAWGESDGTGTPGQANSRFLVDPPPLVVDVEHSPVIPAPSEPVRVTALLSAVSGVDSASLFYEVYGQAGPEELPLLDDGFDDDGIAGNGVHGAEIPGHAADSIVGFWIEVRAVGGGVTTVPAGGDDPRFLYQVLEPPGSEPVRPVVHLVLKPEVLTRFENRSRGSDELLDLTVIHQGRAYYNRGIRLRGNSARSCNPLSYRIQFDHDVDFDGIKRLNLNGCNANRQWAGLDFLRRTGIPTPRNWFRAVSFNGQVDSRLRLRVESVDAQFLEKSLPGDDDGNLYRGEGQANLDYRGEDFGDYRRHYAKVTNEEEDDYSDVVDLCFAFDADTTSDEDFPTVIEQKIDTDQWARYFAAFAVLGSTENSIVLNNGDDYYLYHRFSDDRWILLPWDLDSCFDEEDQVLFRPTVDQIERFLEHPRYAPLYWCHLENFLRTGFRATDVLTRLEHLEGLFQQGAVDTLRNFVEPRIDYISQRTRDSITLSSTAEVSYCDGVLFSSRNSVELRGGAPTCGTHRVLVNGEEASIDPQTVGWQVTVPFEAGQTVEVLALDTEGVELDRLEVMMQEGGGSVTATPLPLSIDDDTTLTAAESPYRARNNWVIQSGATLTIEPGVTVGFDHDSTLTVRGSLIVNGTAESPVTFRSDDCGERWEGLVFEAPGQTSVLRHLRVRESSSAEGRSGGWWILDGEVEVEHLDLDFTTTGPGPGIEIRDGGRLTLRDSQFLGGETALRFRDASGRVSSSTFRGSSGAAVVVEGVAPAELRIDSSLFLGCQTALALEPSSVLLDHLTLHDCGTGLRILPTANAGTVEADSLIIWESHAVAVDAPDPGSLVLTHSDTDGGVWPGTGNISADPRFNAPDLGDFSLALRSPCRGTGKDGSDMGAIPYVPTGETSRFTRCDVNSDGLDDIGDAVSTLLYLFVGSPTPRCLEAVDCNSDAAFNITDAIFNLHFLFLGGDPPAAPFPACDEAAVEDCFESTCAAG